LLLIPLFDGWPNGEVTHEAMKGQIGTNMVLDEVLDEVWTEVEYEGSTKVPDGEAK
jgi:hypothetical protein